ncbi:MAG: 50S ribosomal protein L24 [Sphingobacteriaceae bacterium]|jgi:large subunit ribosomal protein L24|nr:50S ribosomal protein L24 [Sphingobacteriaceae bacterium]
MGNVKLKIKKGDIVRVIAGDDKGKEGRVLEIRREDNRAFVEGVNMITKHSKPNAANPNGGIVKKEAPVQISNLMVVVGGVASKIGRKQDENGKLVRFAKKTGEIIK